MNKNMPNKANLGQSQIFITATSTINYNEKSKLDTWSKQTQTKPILLSLTAGKIAPLFRMSFILRGPVSCGLTNKKPPKSRTSGAK
jgi:hypothetical protein